MESQLITASIALIAVLIGGAINYFSTNNALNKKWRLQLVRERIIERKELYSNFLAASHKLLLQAIDKKISSATELSVLHNEMARIELLATDPVIESAFKIYSCVVDAHTLNEPEKKCDFSVEKKAFIKAVRVELKQLEID